MVFLTALALTARLVSGSPAHVELTNTGSVAVTGWTFAVVSPTATGTHREVHSADVYLSEVTRGLPNANEHLDWLRAGQSRRVPVDAAPAGATVEIVAAVFEDGHGEGDAQTLASLFAHRAAERDELKAVVETMNAALASRRGDALLEELRKRLAQTGGDESVPHRSAREAVETWVRKANSSTSEEDLDRAVRTYVNFVARQYEAAARHAVRKT